MHFVNAPFSTCCSLKILTLPERLALKPGRMPIRICVSSLVKIVPSPYMFKAIFMAS